MRDGDVLASLTNNLLALMMTTLPGDGTTKWSWVMYGIPATASALARNGTGVGVLGSGSHGTTRAYDPPCSQGPGAKIYSFTLYAISAAPSLSVAPELVTGEVLTKAVAAITLGSASLNLSYERSGTTTGPQGGFTIEDTLSDGAQRTTLAFAGLGMITGNLDAQSFFPPGNVADYTGFQYLRDNDPDGMGPTPSSSRSTSTATSASP